MTTRAELIDTIADFLGISEIGQELSAEDSAKLSRYLNISTAELKKKKIGVDIDAIESVEDGLTIALAQYVAYVASTAYNMNPQVLQAKFGGKAKSDIESDLIALVNSQATYAPMQIQVF